VLYWKILLQSASARGVVSDSAFRLVEKGVVVGHIDITFVLDVDTYEENLLTAHSQESVVIHSPTRNSFIDRLA
jgi:hypothetical protein